MPQDHSECQGRPPSQAVHVIACGVLALDLRQIIARLDAPISLQCLPGGLHATPHLLRERLQEAIDEHSARDNVSRIVLAYGVCGRGAVGIHARNVPLAIPRVQDCIALFLGSDARYMQEFSRHPGTYYVSAGWVEEKGANESLGDMGARGAPGCEPTEDERLAREYGTDNAEFIRRFMDSWRRNYTRAAFIDTGVDARQARYEGIAQRMASDADWAYERLAGSHELLLKSLVADETTDEVLVVPPRHMTRYDGVRRRVYSVPVGDHADAAPVVEPSATDVVSAGRIAHSGIGLGIDAGGTYTDAVLFDFAAAKVVGKGKGQTTPWDFTLGIAEALDGLDRALLASASSVAVSTTLATNAIVEGRGQKTGLLVMPPYGWRDLTGFNHAPVAAIKGQLEITGEVREAVDPEEVRTLARAMVAQGVSAFAVGGFASHANPEHELQVKELVERETGLSTTCSHELSEGLDYRIRAETAALNARIIPCLRELLENLLPALAGYGVRAPVRIVRSDGSLMNLELALKRPLETMLSGPAASVAGAAWLARQPNAIVADIGGTTTDTAWVKHGVVDVCDDGATIGAWKTHIRALNLRTFGLGGDSHIRQVRQRFLIGPERVGPICRLAATVPGAREALDWIDARMRSGTLTWPETIILAVIDTEAKGRPPSDDEKRLLELLHARPHSVAEATLAMGKLHHTLLPWRRLAESHRLLPYALTPTDVLHAAGTIALWDAESGTRACGWHATLAGMSTEAFVDRLLTELTRRLAGEIFKKQMADDTDPDALDAQPAATALIDRALSGQRDGYGVRLELAHPIVGVGAPAGCFVPGAAELLNTRAIIPEHADVANAIGAITGSISFRRKLTVAVNEEGFFRLEGVPGTPVFKTIEEATDFGARQLRQMLADLARKAGASNPHIRIETGDSTATAYETETVFINRTIEGWVCDRPSGAMANDASSS